MTNKIVGKKLEATGALSRSYSLYDTCFKCPLSVYIDVVCNDSLDALVVDGAAPNEVLQAIKSSLIIEFSELAGNTQVSIANNSLRSIYLYKSQMQGLGVAYTLVHSGNIGKAINYLSSINEKFPTPKTHADVLRLLKKIEALSKGKLIRFNQEYKRYQSLIDDSGDKVTEQSFLEQLSILSKHVGFHLRAKDITLAEYAAYIKDYQLSISKQNGSK